MNHLERVFSPGQVSNLSGISVALLRDWRRRDLVAHIGEQQPNKRWRYNLREVVLLAVARQVLMNVLSVPNALYIADMAFFSVLSKVVDHDECNELASNYLLIWTEGTPDDPRMFVSGTDDPAELADCKASNAVFVNTQNMADSLNITLKNVIRYGLAQSGRDGIYVPDESD